LLGRHEQVLTLPELQTVPAIKQAAAARIGQYPSGLAELDRQVIEQLRAAYFEEVARFADPGARLIIDKQPLNLVEAGLIYRVFPRAKFIFLLRHPADVCLSCFMQNFRSNPATISFLTLENTVNLYDVAMQAWRQFTRLLPLNVYTVRYELLIDQPAEALRRLGDFLDISAGLQVEEDDPPTLPRGIRTPSYHQVAEPINRRGLYRWQRYREQLGEAIEPLYPWMAALGYDQAALRESSE